MESVCFLEVKASLNSKYMGKKIKAQRKKKRKNKETTS